MQLLDGCVDDDLRFKLGISLLRVKFGARSKSTTGVLSCDIRSVGWVASRKVLAFLFCLRRQPQRTNHVESLTRASGFREVKDA